MIWSLGRGANHRVPHAIGDRLEALLAYYAAHQREVGHRLESTPVISVLDLVFIGFIAHDET